MPWASVVGLAELLASAGIGSWSLSATYPDTVVGVVIGRLPLRPVQVIGLTPYRVVGAEKDAVGGVAGVQVRFRDPSLQVLVTRQQAVFDLLDRRGPTVLGGTYFAQMWCQISTPPGSLGSGDYPELADTYYLRTDR